MFFHLLIHYSLNLSPALPVYVKFCHYVKFKEIYNQDLSGQSISIKAKFSIPNILYTHSLLSILPFSSFKPFIILVLYVDDCTAHQDTQEFITSASQRG